MVCPTFLKVASSVTILMLGASVSMAEMCPREKLDQAVDGAGAELRKLNQELAPRVQAKIRELRTLKGWKEGEAEERAYAAAQDKRLQQLDAQSATLLQKVDQLGVVDGGSQTVDCGRIADTTAAGVELQATVRARSQHLIARLDTLIADAKGNDAKSSAARSATAPVAGTPAPSPQATQQSSSGSTPKSEPESQTSRKSWSTDVTSAAPVPQGAPLPEAAPPNIANSPDAAAGYTIEEISSVAKGIFGKTSAGLANVLEQAFAKSGRPTGYIIGSEAGGALIAGVRYGKGNLVLRTGESVPIFWHGPSIGAEFGASGSEVLFLVYKLANADDIFTTFNGVEGSAYAVGGLGGTYLSNGRVQLAPIRAGVGLRLGANIGYTRFTRRQTWNPF